MVNTAVQIDRKCENTYEIFDTRGRGTTVNVPDHHVLHLARMLGFEPHYPDLEGHLELTTEFWVGTILLKPSPMSESTPFSGREVALEDDSSSVVAQLNLSRTLWAGSR
jgi:hypothetical protein